MASLYLDPEQLNRWKQDEGDHTHIFDYDLDENSVVLDLGGYVGVWAQQVINKYNPNIYIIEPLTQFYDQMVEKFKSNPKVHLLNVGVAIENKKDFIYLNEDSTSSNLKSGTKIEVEFRTISSILDEWGLTKIDLIQMNIEGDEYSMLESMLENKLINKFKNLQVQFHLGIENDIKRREKIKKGLTENGFKNKFDYPFVWESWSQME
jgi:FkbM family methyltransferase